MKVTRKDGETTCLLSQVERTVLEQLPEHEPGPIEKEVVRDQWNRLESGDYIGNGQLLARHLDALTKRLDTLSALVDCVSDFDVEAARREEEDVDNRLATVERAVKRLTKET